MAEAEVHVEYLCAGANRYTDIADWSSDGLLAFGADNNVCLWDPADAKPKGIAQILSGHTGHIRAVKFLPQAAGDSPKFLATGGDDQCLRLWALGPDYGTVSCVQSEHGHTAAINCIAVSSSPAQGATILATGASDATVRIWAFEDGKLNLLQVVTTKQKAYPLSLAISPIGEQGSAYILAVAGTSNVIQIYMAYLETEGRPEFQWQATLPGHENWIRSLDFVPETAGGKGDIFLASASQDKYIRLWRVHQGTAISALNLDALSSMGGLLPGNKLHKMRAGTVDYCVMFEALLLGHEDWVYSAKWHRSVTGKLQLLSASADNSLSIWESDADSGVWVTTARLGEISRDKGATTATGSIGGFWTGVWSPSGNTVITLGRTGAFRRWDYDRELEQWLPHIAISGHTRAVTGISWSQNGTYLLSTSADQTTRLHGRWRQARTWHEMSRPQIHGYDLNCIDFLGESSFVSGADEKLMRVFKTPKAVAKMLRRLTGAGVTDETELDSRPDAANMPVLGLSNKAIDAIEDDADLEGSGPQQGFSNSDRDALDPASMVRKSALDIDHPPFEEGLSRHTLWPEVEKLYGHGYEISCLAASHDGRLIASACKASSVNHAVIRIFETEHWTEVKPPLTAHSLTATRIRFSPDDKYILSVGRDRQWVVFERAESDGYKTFQANPKGHSRMILDAAWAPSLADKTIFATAGRDKQVKLWAKTTSNAQFDLAKAIQDEHPVTAVDFLSTASSQGLLVLAIGTEAGKVSVVHLDAGLEEVRIVSTINVRSDLCLPKAVIQFAWRPVEGEAQQQDRSELAIAGEDGSIRIYSFLR